MNFEELDDSITDNDGNKINMIEYFKKINVTALFYHAPIPLNNAAWDSDTNIIVPASLFISLRALLVS